MKLEIILTAKEPELALAWENYCNDIDFVSIHKGSILHVACDAVVSPANSFGFMEGGIDQLYTDYFGPTLQKKLQSMIKNKHSGELLVGHAEIIETGHQNIPYLIAAPTMRVPELLKKDSINPYLAARAVLLLIKYGTFEDGTPISKRVRTVAFPGLGTGVGQMNPDLCAKQVLAAIKRVVLNENHFPTSWKESVEQHKKLYTLEHTS